MAGQRLPDKRPLERGKVQKQRSIRAALPPIFKMSCGGGDKYRFQGYGIR
jgi:hypothetical protein